MMIRALVIGLFFYQSAVLACSCRAVPSYDERFERAEAVFVGVVTSLEFPESVELKDGYGTDVQVKLRVLELLKGEVAETIVGESGIMYNDQRNNTYASSSCLGRHELGEVYVVFLEGERIPDIGLCSPSTMPYREYEKTLSDGN